VIRASTTSADLVSAETRTRVRGSDASTGAVVGTIGTVAEIAVNFAIVVPCRGLAAPLSWSAELVLAYERPVTGIS
jgi:hypothetical protein